MRSNRIAVAMLLLASAAAVPAAAQDAKKFSPPHTPWGEPGSEAWQPSVVHEKAGGPAVKLSRLPAVGAKWGVWQVSHPHSLSCV